MSGDQRWLVAAAPPVFVVLWASGFIGVKLGMPHVEPFTFLMLRMLAAVALIAVVILVTRPPRPNLAAVGHNVVAGLLMHGGYLGGTFIAISHGLAAGLTSLVVGLQPILLATVANAVIGEKVGARQWLGLVLGFTGLVLVVQDRTVGGSAEPVAWICATVALLSITSGTLYQKKFAGSGIDWRPAFLVQYGATAVMAGVCAMLFETMKVDWTGEFVVALAWLVLVLSFGAIWLLYFLIRRAAATKISSLFFLSPPTTAVMAWAMFGEKLGLLPVIGMAISVTGVFLVNRRGS